MSKKQCIPLIVAALAVSNSYAAFQINSVATPHVISFEENIGYDGPSDSNPSNDVIKIFGATGAYRLMERNSDNWKGSDTGVVAFRGFSAEAWAMRHQYLNLSGAGPNTRTFWGDYNNNADLTNQSGTTNQFWLGTYFGATGNRGLVIGNPGQFSAESTNVDLTLRIQNNTGETVTSWDIGADFWMLDADTAGSNLVLTYSTDDSTYLELDTFTAGNTASVWQEVAGGQYDSIAATVADGDYIYLRFLNNRTGGNGTAWGIDNISVTAVPEPSTYAMISGVVLFAFAAWRRRKAK